MITRTRVVRMTIGVDEETNEPFTKEELVKPLSDEEIPVLTILHNAQSVPLGDAIYETDKEYEKLKKIVIASVKWAKQ